MQPLALSEYLPTMMMTHPMIEGTEPSCFRTRTRLLSPTCKSGFRTPLSLRMHQIVLGGWRTAHNAACIVEIRDIKQLTDHFDAC